jgi:hypothetical protein
MGRNNKKKRGATATTATPSTTTTTPSTTTPSTTTTPTTATTHTTPTTATATATPKVPNAKVMSESSAQQQEEQHIITSSHENNNLQCDECEISSQSTVTVTVSDKSTTVEYYDIVTPDEHTIKSVISIVAQEESIDESTEGSGSDGVLTTHQESEKSFSIITETVNLNGPTASGSSSGSGSGTRSDVSGEKRQQTRVITPDDINPPEETSTRVHVQTWTELAVSAVCLLLQFVILQLQLLLVTKFPSDVSVVSGDSLCANDRHHSSLNTVVAEFKSLCRLASAIFINRLSVLLPTTALKSWVSYGFHLLWICLWPMRLVCRVMFLPLMMVISPRSGNQSMRH